jgi:hypothetical protein
MPLKVVKPDEPGLKPGAVHGLQNRLQNECPFFFRCLQSHTVEDKCITPLGCDDVLEALGERIWKFGENPNQPHALPFIVRLPFDNLGCKWFGKLHLDCKLAHVTQFDEHIGKPPSFMDRCPPIRFNFNVLASGICRQKLGNGLAKPLVAR